jgi:hypothetical protein
MERREKVEEARRETERILAEQEAEVARRKVRGCHSTCALGVSAQAGALLYTSSCGKGVLFQHPTCRDTCASQLVTESILQYRCASCELW